VSFKPYPKYKESGVEWLGRVPEHWELWKVAQAFSIIGSGTTPRSDATEYYADGDVPWVNTGDLNDGVLSTCHRQVTEKAMLEHSSLKLYPAGSILFAMYGATIGKIALLGFPATVNQACCVLGGESPIDARFMFYWFLGMRSQIISLATGGGQPNVSQDIVRSLRVACPSKEGQAAIAAFLGHETAKIDALIAEQQRLIELLQEKRQAVISHAVTKGLNPDAPMKDSGIEWLGEVPEHWEVASLRYFATFCTGATPDRANPSFWNGGIPWVKTGEIDYSLIKITEEDISHAGLDSSSCSIAPEGTLLMALYGQGATRGRVAILGIAAAFNQACVAITTDHRLSTTFLKAFFIFAYSFLRGVGNETTQMNMNVDYVRRVRVTIPPLDEQYAISVHVATESQRFEDLVAEADRTISLLQERRSALISAAVTGQIDVRGFTTGGSEAA